MTAAPRIGLGYDVHRITPGRPLVLGGVPIPSPFGLEGHSDADVLLHAIADALLGAAGLPDIGHHFPPSDPACAGISSLLILERCRDLITAEGYALGNVDATLIAQAPKIAPFRDSMRAAIARALHVSPAHIGIKATTNETLGAIGRGEGIAAFAVALLLPATATPSPATAQPPHSPPQNAR